MSLRRSLAAFGFVLSAWLLLVVPSATADASGSTAQAISEAEDRLHKLAGALRSVSGRGQSEIFQRITGFAHEAEGIVTAAAELEPEARLLALEEGTQQAKGQWVAALTQAQSAIQKEQAAAQEEQAAETSRGEEYDPDLAVEGEEPEAHAEGEDDEHAEGEDDEAEMERKKENLQEALHLQEELVELHADLKVKMQELQDLQSGGASRDEILEKLMHLRDLAEGASADAATGAAEELLSAAQLAAAEVAEADAVAQKRAEQEAEEADSPEAQATIEQASRLLHKATREGELKKVVEFLQKLAMSPIAGARVVNWQDKVGASVLHWCAFYGTEQYVSMAKHFAKFPGMDFAMKDNRGRTACHTACMRGSTDVLRVLLDAGADLCDPMANCGDGNNCAHMAASRGQGEMLDVLREKKVMTRSNVDRLTVADEGSSAVTALWLAVQNGDVDSVRALVAAGADGMDMGRTGGGDDGGEYADKSALDVAQELMERYANIADALSSADSEPSTKSGGHDKSEL